MIDLLKIFHEASFDEILLLLYIFTGGAFVKVLVYDSKKWIAENKASIKELKDEHVALVKTVDDLVERVQDSKSERIGEITRIEMRVANSEKDIEYQQQYAGPERRRTPR